MGLSSSGSVKRLTRPQSSLEKRGWGARGGWEGRKKGDDWQILFLTWRTV